MSSLGRQILADMYDCDPLVLDDEQAIRSSLLEAAQRCGATIISASFRRFEPHGISGVVMIAESHLAIHTWPEHGFAALDLFTCSDRVQPEVCFSYLKEALRSKQSTMQTIERGRPPPGTRGWRFDTDD
jgi:S-adenosylmethionine decarboxylase proenzyme